MYYCLNIKPIICIFLFKHYTNNVASKLLCVKCLPTIVTVPHVLLFKLAVCIIV